MWITLALMLSLTSSLGHGVEPGCANWNHDPSRSDWVCCQRCNPGNRLVTQCGLDPKTLCAPCESETYANGTLPRTCLRCTQCIGLQRVKTECSASSDTVCECAPGFLCGNQACSYCVKQCGKGEEPTESRDCQPCPPGTFNDQIHHRCTKWSSRCPSPNQKIVTAGTSVSNIVCENIKPTAPPSPVKPTATRPDNKQSSLVLALVLAFICICVIVSSALILCAVTNLKKKTLKKSPIHVETLAAGRRQTPEPEHCSFCFPQEEHGSSNGSQSSLLCDDKPFELVV